MSVTMQKMLGDKNQIIALAILLFFLEAQSIMEFFMSGSMAKVLTLLTVISILMIKPEGLFSIKVRK